MVKMGLPAAVAPKSCPPETVTVKTNSFHTGRIYACVPVCAHIHTHLVSLHTCLYTHTHPIYPYVRTHTHIPIYIQNIFFIYTHVYAHIYMKHSCFAFPPNYFILKGIYLFRKRKSKKREREKECVSSGVGVGRAEGERENLKQIPHLAWGPMQGWIS